MTRVQTNNKAEAAALQAALKRERAKNSSLQQNLDQKVGPLAFQHEGQGAF